MNLNPRFRPSHQNLSTPIYLYANKYPNFSIYPFQPYFDYETTALKVAVFSHKTAPKQTFTQFRTLTTFFKPRPFMKTARRNYMSQFRVSPSSNIDKVVTASKAYTAPSIASWHLVHSAHNESAYSIWGHKEVNLLLLCCNFPKQHFRWKAPHILHIAIRHLFTTNFHYSTKSRTHFCTDDLIRSKPLSADDPRTGLSCRSTEHIALSPGNWFTFELYSWKYVT